MLHLGWPNLNILLQSSALLFQVDLEEGLFLGVVIYSLGCQAQEGAGILRSV